MKRLFVLLAVAVPLLANAEVIQYKRNTAPAGGFTVLTSRVCENTGKSFVAFRTNEKNRVTRVGCWMEAKGLYLVVWTKIDGVTHRDTILSPSDMAYADLDDE